MLIEQNSQTKNLLIGDAIIELPKSNLPASAAFEGGYYPFYCSSSDARKIESFLHDTTAIVMGTGGVASVHLGKGKFAYSTDTWAFRAKSGAVETEFLYRILQELLPMIDYAGFEGSGLKHLRKDFVRKLEVTLPKNPLVTSKILEVLHEIDSSIELIDASLEKHNLVKAGMMQDMFSRGLRLDSKLRPPRDVAPKLYKETPIGWIPNEWEFKNLGKCLTRAPKNGFSPREVADWQGLYVLGLSCLTKNGFAPLVLKNAPRHAISSGAALKHGDFLISRANTPELVGLCGVYTDTGEDTIYPDLMMRLSLDATVHPDFLEMYLLSPNTRNRLTALAVGTSVSMVKLNSKSVSSFPLALPNLDEQAAIVSRMQPIKSKIDFMLEHRRKLHLQKSGLMHDLLNGKVPVKVNHAEATHV